MKNTSHQRRGAAWTVFGVTTLAVFMVSLDATVVVALFPALRLSFETSPDWQLSWILNAYTIVYAALLVPAGRWVDRRGHTQGFLVGLSIFTLASALCGFATQANFLISMRILQAVGAAVLTPAALALSLDAFPQKQRPMVVGLWSAFGALAAALGPAAGSWLVDFTSWSMIFWINVPVGIAACVYALRVLPSSWNNRQATAPDWVGSLIFIAGVAVVCVGIVRSSDVLWMTTAATLMLGFVLLSFFAVWVRKHPVTSQDFVIFQIPNVALANLATFLFGAAFGMMFLSFFYFMTTIWSYSQSLAGLAAMPGPLLVIPSAVVAGRLATQFGQRPLLIAGGLIFAAAHLWYLLRVSNSPSYFAAWLPGQLMAGISIGLILPSLTSQALAGLSSKHLGLGSAVNSALRQIGGAVGVAVTVAIIAAAGQSLETFRIIYLVLVIAGLSVALIALGLDVKPFQLTEEKKTKRNPKPVEIGSSQSTLT